MIANRVRTLLATASLISVLAAGAPECAQMTVFDPSNFSQNMLTAARTLQQVNNGIQSLQNEAMSLINKARNLASLPYLSLLELQPYFLKLTSEPRFGSFGTDDPASDFVFVAK